MHCLLRLICNSFPYRSIVNHHIMDGQRPPNDPHNNRVPGKLDAGRSQDDGLQLNDNGEMDVIGNDLRDQGMVVVMFLVGLATFFLRERCTC